MVSILADLLDGRCPNMGGVTWLAGRIGATIGTWTKRCESVLCEKTAPLYCFEQ